MIVVTAVVCVLLLAALLARKSVRAEITIPVEPEVIWSVLTNPETYGEWNPILTAVDGVFVKGATLTVAMRTDDGSTSTVMSKVEAIEAPSKINQTGGIPLVLTFNHTWSLEEMPEGTRVTQSEYYTGIGVLFWDPSTVEQAYHQANKNLHDRVIASQ